ncbi:MAG: Hpt domain-containing protein [Methylococcaceae bacterium]
MNELKNIFDLDQALELAGDDQELFESIAEKFWNRYPELLAVIHHALESSAYTEGRDAAHTLKGNASYLCAAEIHAQAAQLELAFKEHRLEDARKDCTLLEAVGTRLKTHPDMAHYA